MSSARSPYENPELLKNTGSGSTDATGALSFQDRLDRILGADKPKPMQGVPMDAVRSNPIMRRLADINFVTPEMRRVLATSSSTLRRSLIKQMPADAYKAMIEADDSARVHGFAEQMRVGDASGLREVGARSTPGSDAAASSASAPASSSSSSSSSAAAAAATRRPRTSPPTDDEPRAVQVTPPSADQQEDPDQDQDQDQDRDQDQGKDKDKGKDRDRDQDQGKGKPTAPPLDDNDLDTDDQGKDGKRGTATIDKLTELKTIFASCLADVILDKVDGLTDTQIRSYVLYKLIEKYREKCRAVVNTEEPICRIRADATMGACSGWFTREINKDDYKLQSKEEYETFVRGPKDNDIWNEVTKKNA